MATTSHTIPSVSTKPIISMSFTSSLDAGTVPSSRVLFYGHIKCRQDQNAKSLDNEVNRMFLLTGTQQWHRIQAIVHPLDTIPKRTAILGRFGVGGRCGPVPRVLPILGILDTPNFPTLSTIKQREQPNNKTIQSSRIRNTQSPQCSCITQDSMSKSPRVSNIRASVCRVNRVYGTYVLPYAPA